jgi:UDP-N-acetylmuramoylalanine--D-glutamate ligase
LEVMNNKKLIMNNVDIFGNIWDPSYPKSASSARPQDDEDTNDQGDKSVVTYRDWYFYQWEQQLFETSCVQLLGEHNLYNICGVIAIGIALGIEKESIQTTISHFHGLEHRLEFVWIYGWIERYNDAIATTPDATLAAMKSFWKRLGTLFLGGIEGPYVFDEVVNACNEFEVQLVILFPDTWIRIKSLLQQQWYKGKIFEAVTMEDAVDLAYIHTMIWDVALLSCGSPSFSLRTWFEEKGRLFKQAIREKSQ